jgi:hypothetical protein
MSKTTRRKTFNRKLEKAPVAASNRPTASARKSISVSLTEPFYVAVDRQLKTGHGTYEAAERAALAIKVRHPQLHVTVYDAKRRHHAIVQQPKPATADNGNRRALPVQNSSNRRRRAVVATRH